MSSIQFQGIFHPLGTLGHDIDRLTSKHYTLTEAEVLVAGTR